MYLPDHLKIAQLTEELAEARAQIAAKDAALASAVENVTYICGRYEKGQGASGLTIAVRSLLAALTQPAQSQEGKP